MNYKRVYDEIIKRAKLRGLNKKHLEGYFEKHHIVPKCMGGFDEKLNYVLLTAKEHFICHHLLWKSNRENYSLFWSYKIMARCKSRNTSERSISLLTSKQYETLRKIHADRLSIMMTGRIVSDETKEKLRLIQTGKKLTNETKVKLSKSLSLVKHTNEWNEKVSAALRGHIASDEHRKNNSISHSGKKYSDETNAKKGSIGSTNPSARRCKINNIEFGCLKDAVKYANEILSIPKKRACKMFNDINDINFVKC